MRIRRNASKLLASSSPPSASSSAGNDAPCEDSAAAAAADATAALVAASSCFELSGQAPFAAASACARPCPRVAQPLQVCELNRSPWDVMPLCQLDAYQSHLSPQEGGEEENRGFATTGYGIEGNGSGGLRAVIKSTLIRPKQELGSGGLEGEHRHEKQNLLLKKKTKKNSKKRVRKETTLWDQIIKEEARMIEEEQNGSSLGGAICKKSDGKGWHCKRVAKQPYSLCYYHLSQIRAYYHSSHHHLQPHRPTSTTTPKQAAPVAKKASKKKKKKKRMTNSDKDAPEFYYYYSGFGPWRGKRRGGGGGERNPDGAASEANGATTDAAAAAACKGCDDSLVVHGAEDCEQEDDLDPESIDDVEDSSDDVGPIRKRKGRKPIKARSLKSLL